MAGIGFSQDGHEKYSGPGHWNDVDMLVVGWVGWGRALHKTHLSPTEQYTHLSLWSLLASPLLVGCDLTRIDDFTMSLLSNDEVIAIDQDPLGQAAHRVSRVRDLEVWVRPLADGSFAVGLFNRGEVEASVTATWEDLRIMGPQQIRDVWRQKDLGTCSDRYTTTVPRHGVALLKIKSAVAK
jgi:alpha-galactosidase